MVKDHVKLKCDPPLVIHDNAKQCLFSKAFVKCIDYRVSPCTAQLLPTRWTARAWFYWARPSRLATGARMPGNATSARWSKIRIALRSVFAGMGRVASLVASHWECSVALDAEAKQEAQT